jgi:PAS domain S-box-containing protein
METTDMTTTMNHRPELDIDARLVHAAYGRIAVNGMATTLTVVFGIVLLWSIVPGVVLAAWAAALMFVVTTGEVMRRMFVRLGPAAADLAVWRKAFVAYAVAGGGAWSMGPVWLLPNATSAESGLYVSVLFAICAFNLLSSSGIKSAIRGLLVLTLLPPVLPLWLRGGEVELVLVALLLCSAVALIYVGDEFHDILRASMEGELHVRSIVDASKDAIIEIDDQRRVTDWNTRAVKLFGWRQDEILGQVVDDKTIPAWHRDEFRQGIADFLAGRETTAMNHRFEITAQARDGRLFPIEMVIVPIRREGGWRFTAFIADITERRRQMRELQRSQELLSEAQATAAIGNWMWDPASGSFAWSDEMYRIFGVERQATGRLDDYFWRQVHEDDSPALKAAERACLDEGRDSSMDFRIRRPDGSLCWVHGEVRRVVDTQGQTSGLRGTVQDIHARKMTEFALVEAREVAERANRAKSDFLSNMSHELRTPMNAILGFAQMLEFDQKLEPGQQDSVQEILKGGRHLLELINEVLDLARIEAGHLTLTLEPVPLEGDWGVAEECLQLVRSLAARRGIGIEVEIPAGAVVRADRVRLRQVLLNFLSNAVKYNRAGGSIRLHAEVRNDHVRIAVADTGQGIAPDRLAELFQPFNRLGAEGSGIEGTGIGLTITRRIVELMGGEIGVESVAGEGSTFWIVLPRAEAVATPIAAPEAEEFRLQPSGSLRQQTVLCIDDNPANLKFISKLMARRPNIRLETAHTPELGIELARTHAPDLILLDINMPGMDGFAVLKVLRADAQLKDVPVFAVTANAMPRDIERGREAGFAEYVTKPIDAVELLKIVDRYLENAL